MTLIDTPGFDNLDLEKDLLQMVDVLRYQGIYIQNHSDKQSFQQFYSDLQPKIPADIIDTMTIYCKVTTSSMS